ncbi:MAG: hypothetical protein WBP45_05780 [Daejeonella sp.]
MRNLLNDITNSIKLIKLLHTLPGLINPMQLKPQIHFLLLSVLAISISCSQAFSQKKNDLILSTWVKDSIEVNGKINEWNDSLVLYNPATKLNYIIANDDQNIYLAIKSTDKPDLRRILAGGISFNINTEGKKKPGYKVTFPIIDRKSRQDQKPKNTDEELSPAEIKAERDLMLSRLNEIGVAGFKELIDGSISVKNTYGIKATVSFDDHDDFIYELAVPLYLLTIKTTDDLVLSCNIKINGIILPKIAPEQRQGNMAGMQGRQSGGGLFNRNPAMDGFEKDKLFTSTEFWLKYKLAKNNTN